jgi:hypothetical protein
MFKLAIAGFFFVKDILSSHYNSIYYEKYKIIKTSLKYEYKI